MSSPTITQIRKAELDALLQEILKGNVEQLSQHDSSLLLQNRAEVISYLDTILSKEIPLLLEDNEDSLDSETLFWTLRLADFLEATELFPWIEKLCHVPIEDLDFYFEEEFVPEFLPYLLSSTLNPWSALKRIIENDRIDGFIRSACLDALVFGVARGAIPRSEVIEYFKSLLLPMINEETEDAVFCSYLIDACTDLWPGDLLEEIREAFGLLLPDETYINIQDVMKQFHEGQDACIERIQTGIKARNFDAPFFNPSIPTDPQLQPFLKLDEKITLAVAQLTQTPQRNDLCNCGSGQKYKKCCQNKPFLSNAAPELRQEVSLISYSPIKLLDDPLHDLPKSVLQKFTLFYELLKTNPEKLVQEALVNIEIYPNIPMLYNLLYSAYRCLGLMQEAIAILKKTRELFPDYLFGMTEFALYLLRRDEPEQALATLRNAYTLSQLYPERKVFHFCEYTAFSHVLSTYFLHQNNVKQARIYLDIIKKIDPENAVIEILEKQIRKQLYNQLMDKAIKEASEGSD